MISDDIKADREHTKSKKTATCILKLSIRSTFKTWNTMTDTYFSWYTIQFDHVHYEQRVGEGWRGRRGYLTDKTH